MARDQNKGRVFTAGDKVFAKVKGYRAWPAYVVRGEKFSRNKVKYHVVFYHTNEKACCKPEDLFPYLEFKEKYGKPTKLQGFNRALDLIENDETTVKTSASDKVSAVEADVEEIKKSTKKRALEEGSEEVQKNTKKLVLNESDLEDSPVNTENHTSEDPCLEESQKSSDVPEGESDGTDEEKSSKRKKLSESSEHSSPKKGGKLEISVSSEKDDEIHTDATEIVGTSAVGSQKRRVAAKKTQSHIFRPKTVYGEDPVIHLKKVQLYKKAKSTVELSEKNTKAVNKKDEKKSKMAVKKPLDLKEKNLKLSKQTGKNTVSKDAAASDQALGQSHRAKLIC